MAEILRLGGFIKGLDPIVAALVVAVFIIGGYNGWEIFSKKKNKKEATANLMLAWTNLFNLANKKTKIVYHDIMADQMRIVDSSLHDIMHTFQDIYFDLKKEAGHHASDLVHSKDVKVYTFILRLAREEIKTQIREILQENHLSEKTERDLQVYIRQQFDLLSRKFTEELNEMYEDADIPRDVLFRANQVWNYRMFEIFSSMIRSCRDVAIRYEGDLKQIDKQVRDIIQKGEIEACYDSST